MTAEIKSLVFSYLDELHNNGNTDFAKEVTADDYSQHNPHVVGQGLEGSERSVASLRDGIPDYILTIEHQVAEDDKVVSWGRFEGTHAGEYYGVPATGSRSPGPRR